MIEKDNIKELFSKRFENATESVNPDLWTGVQAKMAAAGITSTGVAAKGLSVFAKWMIASTIAASVSVVTTLVVLNNTSNKPTTDKANTEFSSNTDSKTSKNELITPQGYSNSSKENSTVSNNQKPQTSKVVDFDNTPTSVPETMSDYEKSLISPYAPISDIHSDNQAQTDTKTAPLASSKSIKETKATTNQKKVIEENNSSLPVHVDLIAKVTRFPNVFTPNGDGSNDFYEVEVENIKDFKLTIINERNQVVFETNLVSESWNGMFSGENATEGMYAAIVTGKQQNGTDFRDIQLFELKR